MATNENRPEEYRPYVERGVSRASGRREVNSADGSSAKSGDSQTGGAKSGGYGEESRVRSSSRSSGSARVAKSAVSDEKRRFHRVQFSDSKRHVAEGEQPPLIDSIREAAGRKQRLNDDFRQRYEESETGASIVESKPAKGGSVIRNEEFFVPKLPGEDAFSKGGRKRKSRNKKPMRMWKKASLTGTCLFLAFLMCLGLGVNQLLNRLNFVNSASTYTENAEAEAEAAAAAEGVDDSAIDLPDAIMFDSDIENILLIGSDSRSASSTEGRSDAMMVFTIDRKHKKIKLTSLQRDLYVKIPNKYGSKLTSAYAIGGADLTIETIEANLGLTIDKYVVVNFDAFIYVVDKIGELNGHGGIKMTLTAAEANYMCNNETYGLFPRYQKGAGTYYMTGEEALNYARIRKIDSDFGRTNRQRKVIAEIIEELKDVSYLDLITMGYACLEYVTTNFSKGELVGLATEAAEIMNYEINQISIPISGTYSEQYITSVSQALVANLTVNAEQLAAFIYDDDMTYEGNEKSMTGVYIPTINTSN